MNQNLRFAVASFMILVGIVAISAADTIADWLLGTTPVESTEVLPEHAATTSAEEAEETDAQSVSLLPGQIYVIVADFQGPDGILTPIREIEAEDKADASRKEALTPFTQTTVVDNISTTIDGSAVIYL